MPKKKQPKYVVRNKIAPGLASGVEFEVLHEEEDGKHIIVTTYEDQTVIEDGKMVKAKVPINHRILASALSKADEQ